MAKLGASLALIFSSCVFAQQAVDIPAQSLASALKALGQQTGLQIIYNAELIAGKQSPAVQGTLVTEKVLGQLLQGTDITFNVSGNSVVLAIVDSDVMTFDAVKVSGETIGETADGPVEGYVAKRSAAATKTDAPIIETPQSMSVVTKDEIERRNSDTIKSAVSYTPGVIPSRYFDKRYDDVVIRGFTDSDYYLDGLKTASNQFSFTIVEPYGLERIELLRGPSSTLYGQSSTGGIINSTSKRPTEEPVRELKLTLGNNEKYQGAFDFGGSLDSNGQWLYRLTGLVRESETQTDFVRDDRIYIAPSIEWRPTEDTSITVFANYLKDDLGNSGGTAAFLPSSGTALPNPNGKIDRSTYGGEPSSDFYEREQFFIGYDFEHRFNDTLAFKQNIRYQESEFDSQTGFGLGFSDPEKRLLNRAPFGARGDTKSLTADNKIELKWNTSFAENTTLFGIDYYKNELTEQAFFGAGGSLIDIFNPVYGQILKLPDTPFSDNTIDVQQVGLYAQNRMKIKEKWILTLGVRSDESTIEVKNHLDNDSISKQTDNETTARIGLNYLFSNGLSPYISYATSFTPQIGTDFFGSSFKPLTGEQKEIGIKYQPVGSNKLFTASVFDITQENVLTSDPDTINHPFAEVQTGEIRSRGLELEAKVEITDAINIIASYTYLDLEITESNDGTEGNTLREIPTHSGAVWIDYNFHSGSLNGLGIGVGVRATSSVYDSNNNNYELSGYALYDLALHYDFDKYRTSLNVSNLFDKETYSCFGSQCWFGESRNIAVNVSYNW